MATAVETKQVTGDASRIDHREGCPAGRVETFELDRPRNQQFPLGGRVRVTRCIDCGRDVHRDVATSSKEIETDG